MNIKSTTEIQDPLSESNDKTSGHHLEQVSEIQEFEEKDFPTVYIKSETDETEIKEEPLDKGEEDTIDADLFDHISEINRNQVQIVKCLPDFELIKKFAGLDQNQKHSKILPKVGMDKIFRHVTIKTEDGKCVDLILDEEAYKKFLEDDDYAKQLFTKHYDSSADQRTLTNDKKEKEASKAGLVHWTHEMIMLLLNCIVKEKKHFFNKFTRNAAFSAAHLEFINQNYQNMSLDDVKRKWYNMQPTYRKIKEKVMMGSEENPTWPYYHIMDEILRYEKSGNAPAPEKAIVDTWNEVTVSEPYEEIQSTSEKPKKLRVEPIETREEIQSTSERPKKRRKLTSEFEFQEYAEESAYLLKQVCVNLNQMGKGITNAIEEQTKAIKDLTAVVTNYVQFLKQSDTHS